MTRNVRRLRCPGGLPFPPREARGGDTGDLCHVRHGERRGAQVLPRVWRVTGGGMPDLRLAQPADRPVLRRVRRPPRRRGHPGTPGAGPGSRGRRTPGRLRAVRGPGGLHDARRTPRRGGSPRPPLALLRPRARGRGRHGGTIEKFIGDAVMAVWGAPTSHEDDAERAVRTALEIVSEVRGPRVPA